MTEIETLQKNKNEIIDWLKETLSEKRYLHTMRVLETAKQYAEYLNLDFNKVEISCLLHDCAKEYKNQELLDFVKEKNMALDEADTNNPHILHARVGAVIAEEKFKIKDPDILGGIRAHTLAEPNMSKISMIVYLADATEPKRDGAKTKSIVNTLKSKGLEHAVLETIDSKLSYVIKKKGAVHPITLNARTWLINKMKTNT